MKTALLLSLLSLCLAARAQITTPVIRAGFGVDAELRTNYFNGFVQSGNDDWFNNGTAGTGQFVIDTTGAASKMAQYAANPASRRLPFYRTMRVPQFSLVNNRLWIDAVYIRDYNGQAGGDSTAFVSSNKNGDSPGNWSGGVTSVLDKNDIAEMMIHVRRAGPTKSDSLWFIGGMALQGTTGNRYFDFEMYQTDIFYSRATGKFSNYGPDAGHTSWKFDAAGNVIAPGDVIFTAEYSSSSLTNIEARIWVPRTALSIVPAGFDWIGGFDGASTGSLYGYANIRPKAGGTYYTGMQSGNNTWAGPFGFIDGGNNVQANYAARQFMEFSVNLTKLGLDPITLLGGSACGLPFRRILVKTRTSTSFNSELKDFIGPFDFFTAQPVDAMADVPMYCGVIGSSEVFVTNPASASVYTWSTPNGHIVSSNVGPSITVDSPGTYIVTQQLLDGCSSFASDTVIITYDATCIPMSHRVSGLAGRIRNRTAALSWTTAANAETMAFEVQRSNDGMHFVTAGTVRTDELNNGGYYRYGDDLGGWPSHEVYYRLKVRMNNGAVLFTPVIRLMTDGEVSDLQIYPNPVQDVLQLSLTTERGGELALGIYDRMGNLVRQVKATGMPGLNRLQVPVPGLPEGAYFLQVQQGGQRTWRKFAVARSALNK